MRKRGLALITRLRYGLGVTMPVRVLMRIRPTPTPLAAKPRPERHGPRPVGPGLWRPASSAPARREVKVFGVAVAEVETGERSTARQEEAPLAGEEASEEILLKRCQAARQR